VSGRIRLKYPLVVEGRYDKSALAGYVDGVIITTDGFSIFNNKEKQAMLRRIAGNGIIVLTDSDGGGRQIRSFLSGILPSEKIHNIFIPQVKGKESRKTKASKAGTLGVEGMKREVLERLLLPFTQETEGSGEAEEKRTITKTDFYIDGLSGRDMASEKRARLCRECGLPEDMTAEALMEAMNLLYGYEEYKSLVEALGLNL